MISLVEQIAAVLPQTQCRQCGYDGCLPYAQALSQGQATTNLCTPGGNSVIHDLAHLLNRPEPPPQGLTQTYAPKAIAVIDENECIGCTACIKACPVDAIMGSTKHMHTILTNECTGCELCLAPCPVDCIVMQPVADQWLPRARTLVDPSITDDRFAAASQAKQRYQHRQKRLQRLKLAKEAALKRKIALARASTSANVHTVTTQTNTQFNTHDLIAKAMARAQSQQSQRQSKDQQDTFAQQQIAKAQQRAAHRRAERDLRYGTKVQKEAALAWLRDYKQDQKIKE